MISHKLRRFIVASENRNSDTFRKIQYTVYIFFFFSDKITYGLQVLCLVVPPEKTE